MTSPKKSADYLQVLLGSYEHEVFYAIWLDSQHQVLNAQELFRGTVDGASVYPREVVKEGLACNAAAVIFAHNHPSGVTEPSQADIRITERLKEALQLVDIRLLDHIVVGTDVTSMAERGLL
jgi:DNA repair protein RadC